MAKIDPQLEQFIQNQTEKQKMQNLIHELNEKCWDACTSAYKPTTKLDSRTESCIRNCVDRFLDTNIMVTQRLEQKATQLLQEHDSLQLN